MLFHVKVIYISNITDPSGQHVMTVGRLVRSSTHHLAPVHPLPIPARPQYRPLFQSIRPQGADILTRHLTTRHAWRSDVVEQGHLNYLPMSESISEGKAASNPEDKVSTKPWYLQVETPAHSKSPLLERQRIPELPVDPPPLLQPILDHIFTDLGLDDLVIFDLRNVDPPPALGANLLMVIGTARSEKHLHVSADRFCRWLKVAHKLSPYADGLLGRGELKLKLRRKARRARLLSNVGSSETGNPDDGIRTGWICVNIGSIEDGKFAREHRAHPTSYVGFEDEVAGARVVVQMLTQEKREELDLESLWRKMLTRQARREGRIRPAENTVEESQQELLLEDNQNPPLG